MQGLFLRVVAVTGLSWGGESLHWLYTTTTTAASCSLSAELLFTLLGWLSLARGGLLFLIFVCKPRVLRQVGLQRYLYLYL